VTEDAVDKAMEHLLASWKSGDRSLESIEALLADDVVATDWLLPERELNKQDLMKEFYAPILESFPDVSFEVFDTMRDGNRLLVCGIFSGTLAGDHALYDTDFAAHNKRVRWEARDIYRFRGDKIDRIWFANDTLAVAREMGAPVEDFRLEAGA